MHVSFLVAISLIAAPFIQDLDEAKDATDFRVNLWSLDTGEKYYTTANIACVATVKFLGRSRPEAVLVDSTLVEVKGNDLVIRQSAIGHCHKLGDDDTVLSVIADLKPPENIKPGYYVVIVTVTDRHNGVRYVDSDSTLIRLVPRPDRVKRE